MCFLIITSTLATRRIFGNNIETKIPWKKNSQFSFAYNLNAKTVAPKKKSDTQKDIKWKIQVHS